MTLKQVNPETLQKKLVSKIKFFNEFGNQQNFSWRVDNFEIDYIQNRVKKQFIIKLLNLAEFLNRNIAESLTLGDNHSVMGETTNKEEFVIHFISQLTINNLVKKKSNYRSSNFIDLISKKLLREKYSL